jgi:MerR family transcriptional regulator, light-induced transcriptional regulator
MVYLRAKVVKGEKYLYLVKSVWDAKKNTSKQEIVKYLGKASEITKDDIPADYRNNARIISHLASIDESSLLEKEEILTKIRDRLYLHLIKGDFDATKRLYDDYSTTAGMVNFFERILTPVMYKIGHMWAKNEITIADEHVASNIANTLVKMLNSKYAVRTKRKIVICVPEGEEHNLGANILEAHLTSIGHHVYNLTPSEPHQSIVKFIESVKPDTVLISITLPDNIKPAQRLVKKVSDITNSPILVGGQALANYDQTEFSNARIIHENNLRGLTKLLVSNTHKRRKIG